MPYKYFPIEFSSYEDYVKYLKEKGFAIEVSEDNMTNLSVMPIGTIIAISITERYCSHNHINNHNYGRNY